MDLKDLANRFSYHKPGTGEVIQDHSRIRTECFVLATSLNDMLPESREKSLAITHLEEVMMWANAAIARNQEA
jgi:hypothetical protein